MYDRLPTSPSSSHIVCEFSSQLAHVSPFVEGEFLLDIGHAFNLPFDYFFVCAARPHSSLRLIVTAFTEGTAAEGLQAPVAYACVSLPIASPGRPTVTARMWAPHKVGVEFLRTPLVGGAPGPVDARQAGPAPTHHTGINVKEALYVDSVGTLHITVNVLHTTQAERQSLRHAAVRSFCGDRCGISAIHPCCLPCRTSSSAPVLVVAHSLP
ncbi:putative Ciliary basal body-associated, B9 protein [Leishmania utingensis]|uniref:Ciliary basal body-associated, B9 protein n=1 Tax=Leishmania utingensis TaxID=653362 RepID=A0AAW3AFN2_9TRYP